MKETADIFKLLSDESRMRILMLLVEKELCVCQIMGVLNLSQPLISRNLSLLARAGFLSVRNEGKLTFYRIKSNLAHRPLLALTLLKKLLENDKALRKDRESLQDCTEFQKKTGACNMETFRAFMEYRKKKKRRGVSDKSPEKIVAHR